MSYVWMEESWSHREAELKSCSWWCVGSLQRGSYLISPSAWLPPTQQVAGSVWHNYIQTWGVFLFFQNLPKFASSRHFLRKRRGLQKILCCRICILLVSVFLNSIHREPNAITGQMDCRFRSIGYTVIIKKKCKSQAVPYGYGFYTPDNTLKGEISPWLP